MASSSQFFSTSRNRLSYLKDYLPVASYLLKNSGVNNNYLTKNIEDFLNQNLIPLSDTLEKLLNNLTIAKNTQANLETINSHRNHIRNALLEDPNFQENLASLIEGWKTELENLIKKLHEIDKNSQASLK